MSRARLCVLISLGLFACKRETGPATVGPNQQDPSDPAKGSDAATGKHPITGHGAIVAVRQGTIDGDPSGWVFDPSGRLVAAEYEDLDADISGCGVWDIESGLMLQTVVAGDDGRFDPCAAWDSNPRQTSGKSADGRLEATLGGELQIKGSDGSIRPIRGCATCDGTLAWAPTGHNIATSNGERVEIWDADTGARIASEALVSAANEDVLLGWAEDGLAVLVVHEVVGTCEELAQDNPMYCDDGYGSYDEEDDDYDEDDGDDEDEYDDDDDDEEMTGVGVSSFWWPSDGAAPVANLEFHTSVESLDIYADAGLHWVAFRSEVGYDRSGVETTLNVLGTRGQTSDLGWTDAGDDMSSIEPWDGRWRVDASTQWIEGLIWNESLDDYESTVEVGWHALVAEPNPGAHTSIINSGTGSGSHGAVEVFAAASGEAVTRWELCSDESEDPCPRGGPEVGDCELLDASPNLSLALVDCDDSLRLIEATGRGALVAKLPNDASAEWRWGRGNYLALLDPGGDLTVRDLGTSKPLYTRTDVLELLTVPLASEQDRLALKFEDRIEIIDGLSGTKVIAVRGDWSAAALSPSGDRLALLEERRIRVVDIATGAKVVEFPVADALGLAWRQDGAALFYGIDWPTHAVNPQTGVLISEVPQDLFELIDPEQVDPSWRWISLPNNTVSRILDFAEIELSDTCARLPSGVFDGEITHMPDDTRFRVGGGPESLPIYTTADLEPWLRMPGLVSAFFRGDPLPIPTVPADPKTQAPAASAG